MPIKLSMKSPNDIINSLSIFNTNRATTIEGKKECTNLLTKLIRQNSDYILYETKNEVVMKIYRAIKRLVFLTRNAKLLVIYLDMNVVYHTEIMYDYSHDYVDFNFEIPDDYFGILDIIKDDDDICPMQKYKKLLMYMKNNTQKI